MEFIWYKSPVTCKRNREKSGLSQDAKHYKEENRKKTKKKKGWIFWKRKKFNGISEHNKPQDKWRKQASKDEHGDDTLQMSKKY